MATRDLNGKVDTENWTEFENIEIPGILIGEEIVQLKSRQGSGLRPTDDSYYKLPQNIRDMIEAKTGDDSDDVKTGDDSDDENKNEITTADKDIAKVERKKKEPMVKKQNGPNQLALDLFGDIGA